MSLIESQIVEVRLKINPPDSVDLISVVRPTINIVAANNQPTVNIVAANVGPRGPKGEAGQWIALTQSEYDSLSPPDPDVMYVIIQ